MVGSAIGSGVLTGIGFWGAEFFERHTSLSADQAAGVAGSLILLGALFGTLGGAMARDRLLRRGQSNALGLVAVTQAFGAVGLLLVFAPTPLALKLPVSIIAVGLVVAGLPALSATTADIVAAPVHGLAFSVTQFLSALTSAISPLLIGFLADRFDFAVDGESEGHLANAFLLVTPVVFVGSFVLWRGRGRVEEDLARARANVVG